MSFVPADPPAQNRAGNNDYGSLVTSLVKMKGLLHHHIASFDHLIDVELKKILLSDVNCEIKSFVDPSFVVRYTDIRVERPHMEGHMVAKRPVLPQECRLTDNTYQGNIVVDIQYTSRQDGVKQTKTERDVHIGKIPIMLRSKRCHLYNKSPEEMTSMRECPMDPGGYFLVKGVERVVFIQEQQSKNRIIVESDEKGCITASVQSKTHYSISKCSITEKKGRLYMTHRSFKEGIPIVILLKALSLDSDQAIVQHLTPGNQPAELDLLVPSLEEAARAKIYSQNEALLYIGERKRDTLNSDDAADGAAATTNAANARIGVHRSRATMKADDAADWLGSVLLCHIRRDGGARLDWNLRHKALYVCCMVRRMLDAMKQRGLLDAEKDYYGNKRFETTGTLMGLLFEDALKNFNKTVRVMADNHLTKKQAARDINLPMIMDASSAVIEKAMTHTISTGNFDLKRFNMRRAGVTQVLSRQSYIAAIGMMTRLASSFEKSRKISGPRQLQPSQWGMVCPCDTPEGESCGLVKNFAVLSQVTLEVDDTSLRQVLFNVGIEELDALAPAEFVNNYTCFLNGVLIGIVRSPNRVCFALRRLRRCGRVHPHVSVYVHDATRSMNVSCDSGRVIRLYMTVRGARPAVTSTHLDELKSGLKSIADFLAEGLVEYLDVNEANDCLIAVYPSEVNEHTTHLEIEPFTLLGVVAGIIPFPHHNQSARNSFQCAMGKQALGTIGLNQMFRADTVLIIGGYPQRPLCRSKAMALHDYENLGAGINAMVAVMSYSGYDIEDAQVYNRDSLDRGYARVVNMRRTDLVISLDDPDRPEKVAPPPNDVGSNKRSEKYRALDKDGIVARGARIVNGDVLVNKLVPAGYKTLPPGVGGNNSNQAINVLEYIMAPIVYRGRDPAIVDHVIISPKGPSLSIKIVTRELRIPELGDKFSSRHGQKGVVGLITNGVNMPFSERGVTPDMIMNPHGFPSRMTVGKLMELVSGKAGVIKGTFGDGTAFAGDDAASIGKALVDNGFMYYGKELLYSGITGDLMPSFVFFGPVYYQRLRHMVADKMHARSIGPRSMMTRQPMEGRSRDGGLRIGEMERDCMVGYGAAMLLNERLLISSDVFCVDVCTECGYLGWKGQCHFCKRSGTVSSVNVPYAFKLLMQEMLGMGISVRLKLNKPNA